VTVFVADLLFVLLAVFLPGRALLRILRLEEDSALVLPLGIVFASFSYFASLVVGAGALFPALALAADATLLVLPARGRASGPPLRTSLLPAAALVALLAVTDYPLNRVGPGGGFILDKAETVDTAFHVAVAHELAHGYPPEVPGLSGVRLFYHYGPDLLRAAAERFAGVSPYDSVSRYDVTLAAIALLLVVQALAFRLGGDRAAALAGFTLLATDFSFLLPLLDRESHWWAQLLNSNLLPALVLANGSIPALALAGGALLALGRHEDGEGGGFLLVGAVLAFAVPFFKIFLAGQLLAGLALAFLLTRRRSLLALAAPCLATTLVLVAQGAHPVSVTLDPVLGQRFAAAGDRPFVIVQAALDNLSLPPATGVALVSWTLAFILAGLGLRVFGLGELVRALRSGRGSRAALAGIALSGIPAALLVRIHLKEIPGWNEAGYFVLQSGALLWVFASVALSRHPRRPTAALFALLAFPSTAEFVLRKVQPMEETIPASVMRVTEDLRKASAPGDAVLVRPHLPFPPPPLVFAGRRLAFTTYIRYLAQFAPESLLESRHAQVRRFFETEDPDEGESLARSLGARFLCLYPDDRLRFPNRGLLTLVAADGGSTVYRIEAPPGGPPGPREGGH
jgi:hypothetical protein